MHPDVINVDVRIVKVVVRNLARLMYENADFSLSRKKQKFINDGFLDVD